MSLKIRFYLMELLEELKNDSEQNAELIKKLKEVMPFYYNQPEEEFFNKLDYFLGTRDTTIFLIIYAKSKELWDEKDIMFIGDFCSFLAKYDIAIDYYNAYINIFFKEPNYSLIVNICNSNYGFSYLALLELIFLNYNILTSHDEITKVLEDMAKSNNKPFYNLPDIYCYLNDILNNLTKDDLVVDFESFRLLNQLKSLNALSDEDLKKQIIQELADVLSQPIGDDEKLASCLNIIRSYNIDTLKRIKPNENE